MRAHGAPRIRNQKSGIGNSLRIIGFRGGRGKPHAPGAAASPLHGFGAIIRAFPNPRIKGALMSANEDRSHNSPVKTSRQLVTVVMLAIVVAVIVIVLLTQLVIGGRHFDKDSPAMSPAAVEERIKPVAEVNTGGVADGVAAVAPATGARAIATASEAAGKPDGRKVYESTCTVCHGPGVAGAPKLGDKAAWAPHLAQGVGSLYTSALKGKGAMPPKGGNLTLPDADIKAAVDYLVGAVK